MSTQEIQTPYLAFMKTLPLKADGSMNTSVFVLVPFCHLLQQTQVLYTRKDHNTLNKSKISQVWCPCKEPIHLHTLADTLLYTAEAHFLHSYETLLFSPHKRHQESCSCCTCDQYYRSSKQSELTFSSPTLSPVWLMWMLPSCKQDPFTCKQEQDLIKKYMINHPKPSCTLSFLLSCISSDQLAQITVLIFHIMLNELHLIIKILSHWLFGALSARKPHFFVYFLCKCIPPLHNQKYEYEYVILPSWHQSEV